MPITTSTQMTNRRVTAIFNLDKTTDLPPQIQTTQNQSEINHQSGISHPPTSVISDWFQRPN